MKLKSFVVILAAAAALSCGRGTHSSGTDVPGDSLLGACTDSSLSDAFVPVVRIWMDVPEEAFLHEAPSGSDIARWKSEFESVGPKDSVWANDVTRHGGMNRYLTVNDFIELWHGPDCGSFQTDDRRTMWRLLQSAQNGTPAPRKGFDRIARVRTLFEDLLDYENGSQWDMTFHAWLELDFRYFYSRLLFDEMCREAEGPLREALRREERAVDAYHRECAETYQTVMGGPGWNGSSFPYRAGMYGKVDYEMELRAGESFLRVLLDGPPDDGEVRDTSLGEDLVYKEFDTFASTFEEDEYSYPVKERRAALKRDREAWKGWMKSQSRVSGLLDGAEKEAYDRATLGIIRHKLVMLKNRYNADDGYCPDYVCDHLLTIDSTDEEILAHNLENLIENE